MGKDDVVRYLLEWINNLESSDDVLNSLEDCYLTALYQAAISSLKTVKSLATEKNINIAVEDGRSPLNWAVQNRVLRAEKPGPSL